MSLEFARAHLFTLDWEKHPPGVCMYVRTYIRTYVCVNASSKKNMSTYIF